MKDAVEAINESIKLLDETLQNLKDKKSLEFNLWKVTLELDYAALALSLFNNLIDFNPNPNNNFPTDSIEETLIKAQNLLKKVLKLIDKEPKTAYEKIKQVIKLIRKVRKTS
ncbi:MAG: hypothetical protein QXL69_01265 [Candidatus Bathyarchaeia archaeon]